MGDGRATWNAGPARTAAEIFGDADPVELPEIHRFSVPEGCHWRDVRETPANLGAALARAIRESERANPDTLCRVFGAADWGNREMLTDGILKDLIEGLSEVGLGNAAVSSDILGDAYILWPTTAFRSFSVRSRRKAVALDDSRQKHVYSL